MKLQKYPHSVTSRRENRPRLRSVNRLTAIVSPPCRGSAVQLQPLVHYRFCQPIHRTASTARAAQQGNRPHSLGSSRRTVPAATLTAAAGTLQTASGASAAKRLYQHISYRQHDRADRKGDKPLAFREFLNLRQHIKEFAP